MVYRITGPGNLRVSKMAEYLHYPGYKSKILKMIRTGKERNQKEKGHIGSTGDSGSGMW